MKKLSVCLTLITAAVLLMFPAIATMERSAPDSAQATVQYAADSETGEMVIEDEGVPLAGGVSEASSSGVNYGLVVVIGAGVCMLAAGATVLAVASRNQR